MSLILVRLYCRYALMHGLIDIPNDRSSHQIATPRGAGIVFVVLWLSFMTLAWLLGWLSFKYWLLLVPATAIVSTLGFWDDHQGLSAKVRLWFQALVALCCVSLMDGIPSLHLFGSEALYLGSFGMIIGVLWMMWSVNLFNFMDGIDGLASIETFFVLGFGGLLFWLQDQSQMALITWAMLLAVAGFLVWNWPKAKVFMGDAGSYCLGFLVAILALVGDRLFNIPISLWLILYAVFCYDATVTLIRRIILRKHWATAHRDHAYQRMHQAGFSHKHILFIVIALNSVLGVIALWTFYHPSWMMMSLLFTLVLLTLAYTFVERLKPIS